MKVQMLELSEQYELLKEDIHNVLEEVIASSHFILGENVKRLEENVAKYSHAFYGIGVASGSDALLLSLLACGVKEGDEVLVPSFTFFATAGAVARCGAKPVFVDIEPITFTLNPEKIEAAITKKTRAIIPVHLYGQTADMDPINEVAKKYHLAVIEDAAQAIGAEYKGKRVGTIGTVACYSFFPTKNLGAYGDGGMVVTNNGELAEKIQVLRVHGSKPKYHHHVLGFNSRLDELQAAILNIKLPHLDNWNKLRLEKATNYTKLINATGLSEVTPPQTIKNRKHVFHQYTIRTKKRDELQTYFKEQGIETMVYYPKPLHLQPVFLGLGYQEGDLPETEKACREALSLPMFPELKGEQQEEIIEKMERFFKK
ncbi:DegT/DnrJ/EryC1/StrS family aminotransferase [Halalkalibacterium ligniniphilum]|uniref:DegT/DnrJ/EryC1/StrS family aminotransferase n=1 Tax=Halalkalibacterium ligniniphilum TaxID=1134413 RepID=UPI0003475324|nr:DegT/DnrJ/EryC1/StrS family aminotransferase [Halalkalibacterium ligniniphilum]